MHIEVWQSPPRIGDQRWHWHIVSRGRIVADAESFPTKQHAVRSAEAVVRQIVKRITIPPIYFTLKEMEYDPDGFAVRWKVTWA